MKSTKLVGFNGSIGKIKGVMEMTEMAFGRNKGPKYNKSKIKCEHSQKW